MKTVCFGELLLRLNPPQNQRFVQSSSFEIHVGGAEANAAISLAAMGTDVSFVTALPPHEIGQLALNELRRYGVNTDGIVRGGDRVGIYYLENGAAQRGGKVIYDRAGSSAAMASPDMFDWEYLFKDADIFHFTGITAAISDSAAECCRAAAETAKRLGVKVSCDLNYRSKLWSTEKAAEVMRPLIAMTDICIANEEHAASILGVRAPDSMGSEGDGISDTESYKYAASEISRVYGCGTVAITLRSTISASDCRIGALLYRRGNGKGNTDGDEFFFSPVYNIHIVDRIGGGDAFDAGLLYAEQHGFDGGHAVSFAAAAEALKHSVPGDFSLCTAEETEACAAGNGSRVAR